IRLAPVFLSVSERCRSSISAAPRAVALQGALEMPSSATGASLGTSTMTEQLGSAASCARRQAAPRSPNSQRRYCTLLNIDGIDRHVARFGIYVPSPHGTLCIERVGDALDAVIGQAEGLATGRHFNSVLRVLDERTLLARGSGNRAFEDHAGDHQDGGASECHDGASTIDESGLAQGRVGGANALPAAEAKTDIGFDSRRQPVPLEVGDCGEAGEAQPHFIEGCDLFAAILAPGDVAGGEPPGEGPEVTAGVQRQGFLIGVSHCSTASFFPCTGGTWCVRWRCGNAPWLWSN